MRYTDDIFENDNHSGTDSNKVSEATVAAVIFGAISVVAAIGILANFGEITACIAIWVADFLSSGFPILVLIIAVIYFWLKLKWKLYRSFWGW